MYYVGESFNAKENKAYKTLSGAKKAALNGGKVFDGEGKEIVAEGAQSGGAGKIKVVYNGTVRIRKTASFRENNVVGFAKSGAIFDIIDVVITEDGGMYQIENGLFISADPKIVERIE